MDIRLTNSQAALDVLRYSDEPLRDLMELFGEEVECRIMICHDSYHPCYGKKVHIYDGERLGHRIHIERVEDVFHAFVDDDLLKFNMSYREMESYILGRVL